MQGVSTLFSVHWRPQPGQRGYAGQRRQNARGGKKGQNSSGHTRCISTRHAQPHSIALPALTYLQPSTHAARHPSCVICASSMPTPHRATPHRATPHRATPHRATPHRASHRASCIVFHALIFAADRAHFQFSQAATALAARPELWLLAISTLGELHTCGKYVRT